MMNRPSVLSLVAHGLWERVQYPGLLVVLALFWFALAGFFGATAIGFPYLFWHADAEIAICSGLAIGVFLGEWCLVNFTLDTSRSWMKRWAAARSDHQILMRYLFCTNLLFASLFLPTPFFYRVGHELVKFNLVRAGMSAMAIVTGVTVYVCLINWLSMLARSEHGSMPRLRNLTQRCLMLLQYRSGQKMFRRLRLGRRSNSDAESQDASPEPVNMVWVHVVGGMLFWMWLAMLGTIAILYFAGHRHTAWMGAALSPGVLTCTLLIILIRVYGFLVYHLQRLYFAFLFSFVALYLAVSYYDWFGHKYTLPNIHEAQEFATAEEVLELQHQRVVATRQAKLRDTDTEALQNWMQRVESEGRPPILVVVAASGGGIRASIWTTAVLAALEKVLPELPYQTRLVTGASGGMVGAAGYVGTLEPPHAVTPHGLGQVPWPVERIVEASTRDSLTPTARTLFFRDLPRQFVPWIGGIDRGEALQRAWVENSGGPDSPYRMPLSELAEGELEGWRPSLVFTPALLEDGKRLFISNLNLAPLTTNQLADPARRSDRSQNRVIPRDESVSAIEAQLFDTELGYHMDLGTAARLNASFPLVSPAIAMPVHQVQWSVADASYYDNYGLDTIARWLNRHQDLLEQWKDEGRLQGILVVQIVSSDEPRNQVPSSMPKWTDGWLTPLSGLFVHVMQKVVFTSDEQLEVIGREFNDGAEDSDPSLFFRHATISFKGQASLSWYLTPEEVRSLIYPFELNREGGQLDFQRFASVEFHSLMERSGLPTEEMQQFRAETQAQLRGLQRWWHRRSAEFQRERIEMSAIPNETR